MAQLIDIQRVQIDDATLTAHVRLSEDAPLMTNDDLEGTTRVYYLMPHIVEHTCLGDVSKTFRDVMGATEVAHLLEHATVELLAQTNLAGDISCGRTTSVEGDQRAWDIKLACPDDVLVAGALASAAWILQWAYTGGGEPKPDIKAIVQGLSELVGGLSDTEVSQIQENKDQNAEASSPSNEKVVTENIDDEESLNTENGLKEDETPKEDGEVGLASKSNDENSSHDADANLSVDSQNEGVPTPKTVRS
jgi:hypothetical protein